MAIAMISTAPATSGPVMPLAMFVGWSAMSAAPVR
jgi:hypothetical protein